MGMSSRNENSKRILKILGEKNAVSLPDIREKIGNSYAINRSIKGLKDTGTIESVFSGQGEFYRLTKEGKKKLHSQKLKENCLPANISWDGLWRIILLDLPENRKNERESLRYLLKKAGFVCLKNSAWISPYPLEHLFINIKKDLELKNEMMIIVTPFVDEETKGFLFKSFSETND
jgi:DNA-binding transcriptional regulator PaaX